jgi:hypothetical protein
MNHIQCVVLRPAVDTRNDPTEFDRIVLEPVIDSSHLCSTDVVIDPELAMVMIKCRIGVKDSNDRPCLS